MPFAPRKSEMPDSVEIPAPVKAMAYLDFASAVAAFVIRLSIFFHPLNVRVFENGHSMKQENILKYPN
jgi:hypothetical protein